ncbi:MAG: RIP metalloprotease RseP [Chloroflexi bacterium]|nr:RIP metalloprotease RseP [Chloroflexota bacterium]
MSSAIAIICFIAALVIMMVAHEMGHLIASKRAGVLVQEFGIGFPPRLFAIKRGETEYSINLIPVGAFVRTPGESDHSVPGSLASKGPWTRMGVYAAGPIVNILLAFVVLSVFFALPTEAVKGDGVMVHSVSSGSSAEGSLSAGDIILRIGDKDITEWQDVRDAVNSDDGGAKTLLIQRGEEQSLVTLEPRWDDSQGRYTLGVVLCWGIVTDVETGSSAHQAGIMPGDTIVGVNDIGVYSDESILDALKSSESGETVDLTLLRNGEDGEEVTSASLQAGSYDSIRAIGVNTNWVGETRMESERLPLWRALYAGGNYMVHVPTLIRDSIPLIREDPSKAVVGVVGAGQLTVEAVKSSGLSTILLLSGMISIGLALFNFIPIPPLDGGGMLIGLIEGIRGGRRLSVRTVRLAYTVGTVLMITLFVAIMYSDIARLIRGQSFL